MKITSTLAAAILVGIWAIPTSQAKGVASVGLQVAGAAHRVVPISKKKSFGQKLGKIAKGVAGIARARFKRGNRAKPRGLFRRRRPLKRSLLKKKLLKKKLLKKKLLKKKSLKMPKARIGTLRNAMKNRTDTAKNSIRNIN